MCIVPGRVKPENHSSSSLLDAKMSNSTEELEPKISFFHLLELAADDDVEGFKEYVALNPNSIDEIGLWYGRKLDQRGMVLHYRTPLMIAALYGSLNVVKLILSFPKVNVNHSCIPDNNTALHFAASGGSPGAIEAVKLLLANGADPNLPNAKGNYPFDVIDFSGMPPQPRTALEELLTYHGSSDKRDVRVSVDLPISDFPESNVNCHPVVSEKKEYPVDPSLPDIKNSIYASDEFRMYSFKVRPCSRAYSHDWTECPFVHPGENARRRDPRKYHYSCVPCPDFRKGSCRRGDMCEYAHGVFECWLHPAQYRTRLCKDGTACNRRVCFFAHTPEELRPLYPSTGSAVLSPRSVASAAAVMDMAAALSIFPSSPSPFTPPMSPSGNGMPHSPSAWQQPNMPTLLLPGSNIQASRLRSSLNARDVSARSKTAMAPTNLDELFSGELSSPRFSDQLAGSSMFSPSHKSAVLNHFQQQQNMLSPINTKAFSPNPADHLFLQQPSFGLASPPGMMSPRRVEPHSPLNARLSALALREKQQPIGSLSARDLIPDGSVMAGSPLCAWSKWESPEGGGPDWSVNGNELNQLKRSCASGHNGEEPDVSWVQLLVKDSPSETKEGLSANSEVESVGHSAWGMA